VELDHGCVHNSRMGRVRIQGNPDQVFPFKHEY
jgi:hypothetical protein